MNEKLRLHIEKVTSLIDSDFDHILSHFTTFRSSADDDNLGNHHI